MLEVQWSDSQPAALYPTAKPVEPITDEPPEPLERPAYGWQIWRGWPGYFGPTVLDLRLGRAGITEQILRLFGPRLTALVIGSPLSERRTARAEACLCDLGSLGQLAAWCDYKQLSRDVATWTQANLERLRVVYRESRGAPMPRWPPRQTLL